MKLDKFLPLKHLFDTPFIIGYRTISSNEDIMLYRPGASTSFVQNLISKLVRCYSIHGSNHWRIGIEFEIGGILDVARNVEETGPQKRGTRG